MTSRVRSDFTGASTAVRILVIGGSGLVGSHVLGEARSRGHDVAGTYRNHPVEGLSRLDLDDEVATRRLIDGFRPDWVVHAAGWTWVDGCESDPVRAMRENAEQPGRLARICAERGIRIAYFSTSYVFDGVKGGYTENDVPAPINAYARSKLAGEQAVRAGAGELALVPRVICVWGRESQKKNFAYQVIKAVTDGRPMQIPSDQCGNPTWAGDIAAWLVDLMEAGETGSWHLAGDHGEWTREHWLRAILDGLNSDPAFAPKINAWRYTALPTATLLQPAQRPVLAGMNCSLVQRRFPRSVKEPGDVKELLATTD
jgi:dTDP-4-dehydrorhamnose reductase